MHARGGACMAAARFARERRSRNESLSVGSVQRKWDGAADGLVAFCRSGKRDRSINSKTGFFTLPARAEKIGRNFERDIFRPIFERNGVCHWSASDSSECNALVSAIVFFKRSGGSLEARAPREAVRRSRFSAQLIRNKRRRRRVHSNSARRWPSPSASKRPGNTRN